MTEYLISLDYNDRLGTLYKVEDNGTIEVTLSRDGDRETYQISLIEKDVFNWSRLIVHEWNLDQVYTFDQYHWMMLREKQG